MRLLKAWTAVLVLAAIVTATGCGGSSMSPAAGAGKMDDKMMSDGKMMSSETMATDGNMMGGKMASDNKMSEARK